MGMNRLHRREFLGFSAAALAGATLAGVTDRTDAPLAPDSLAFASALEVARAIRSGQVSSLEITEHMLQRIEKHNPGINAVVTVSGELARTMAKAADEALARGEWWGPFHGAPWLVKDTFEAEGLRTTAGSVELKDYVSKSDAVVVDRMHRAGAVCLGKSNVPLFAADMQTFNEVFGTTNNPWNTKLSPGGSTGGGAAALAAGLCYLALGSDIGGSIRNPSHFCGVYGHKPTYGIVPTRGELASLPDAQPYPPDQLSVSGQLARSAADLRAMLEVMAGPDEADALAYTWRLPQARGSSIRDFRIGYVLDDPLCPVRPEVKAKLDEAVAALRKAGAKVDEGWPEGIDVQAQYGTYAYLLLASYAEALSDEEAAKIRELAKGSNVDLLTMRARAFTDRHNGFAMASRDQMLHRAAWLSYFKTHDAFLLPTAFTAAFEHVQTEPLEFRSITTPEGARAYTDLLFWISFATMTGCPATVAPVGLAANGLPVGVQIMGPYMEDATPIALAGHLAEIAGGFVTPPGYGV
ncbi:MAG: amidase [Candidatus Hydrogenedentes bacterium]|nr:amidase [Candidatus Hydrogenedentota bacterium]